MCLHRVCATVRCRGSCARRVRARDQGVDMTRVGATRGDFLLGHHDGVAVGTSVTGKTPLLAKIHTECFTQEHKFARGDRGAVGWAVSDLGRLGLSLYSRSSLGVFCPSTLALQVRRCAGDGTGDAARTDCKSGASTRRGAPRVLPPCATLGGRSRRDARSITAISAVPGGCRGRLCRDAGP